MFTCAMNSHLRPLLVLSLLLSPLLHAGTIKLASVSPLSGSQAGLGETIKLGAQMALEEAAPWFEERGHKLVFLPQDDQASPDVGVAVARRMVNDDEILGVIGHLNTGVAMPSSEVYKDFDLCMVSPANTGVLITDRRYPSVNRICGRDDIQGPVGASFAVEDLKASKIYVVHDKTAYGQGIALSFREKAQSLGAQVVGFDGTEEKSNFHSLILRMKVMKPDLLFFGGIYDQGGVLLKQMREKGIKASFLGPDGLDSAELVNIAQDAVIGAYYTTVAGPVDQFPAAQAFNDRYVERFKKPPESYALYAYDTANVFVAALKKFMAENDNALPTRKQLAGQVRDIQYDGITGTIAFDDKGDRLSSDYYVIKFEAASYPGTTVKAISSSSSGN